MKRLFLIALWTVAAVAVARTVRSAWAGAPFDFTQFYIAGTLAADGRIADLYDASAHAVEVERLRRDGAFVSPIGVAQFARPPIFALLYTPLAVLDYASAFRLFTVMNLLLLVLLVWLLPRWLASTAARFETSLLRACLAMFAPSLYAIRTGQDALVVTFIVAAAVRWIAANRDLGGLGLAGALLKPHVIWAVPFGLWAARRGRAVLWFAAGAATIAIASVAVVGVAGNAVWLRHALSPRTDMLPERMVNVRAVAVVVGPAGAAAVTILTLTAFAWILSRRRARETLPAAICISVLLGPHTYVHDLAVLTVAACLVPHPALRYALLLPWPYVLPWPNFLPAVAVLVAFLLGLAAFSVREKEQL